MIDLAAETRPSTGLRGGLRAGTGRRVRVAARQDGTLDVEAPRELWINTRMTYVFALARGVLRKVEWGLAALRDVLSRRELRRVARVGGTGQQARVRTRLRGARGGDGGRRGLLGEALEVLETRFWDEEAGALVDVWSRDWSSLEPYRGANANMHGVEAMLAHRGPALARARARG